MRAFSHAVALLALIPLGASAALAVPSLVLDMDPTAAGVQSRRSVGLGEAFSVDLRIQGVEAEQPLIGYDVTLDFPETLLADLGARDGGFLDDPLRVPVEAPDGTVRIAALQSPPGVSGGGVLASFDFRATAVGEDLLDLPSVLLAGEFGQSLPVASVTGGNVAVTAVPEPGAALLFGLGWLAAGRATRRRPAS